MKHLTNLTIALWLLSAVSSAQTPTPAFPGAEGAGRYTQGGRAADGSTHVYHVTNLNDSGEGSLRWALSQTGPRTIVFDVAGYIDLTKQLDITSNTTIAGQTAPEPGITLRYYTVYFAKASNVICRFIRFRRSQIKDVDDGADATWGRNQKNIILDHCSFSWSIDEVASFYDNRDFTMQWCVLGEALHLAGHQKGPHSYGGLWGGKPASFLHNMICHVDNRCPRINSARYMWDGYDKSLFKSTADAERVDLRNCLFYNWGNGNGAYGNMGGYLNIVNNYYQAGPGTSNKTRVFQASVSSSGNSDKSHTEFYGMEGRYYVNGNYVSAVDPDKDKKPRENYDYNGFKWDGSSTTYTDKNGLYGGEKGQVYQVKLGEPITATDAFGFVTTQSAVNARNLILQYGGSSLHRDAVDERYMDECTKGTATYTGEVTSYVNSGTTKTGEKVRAGIVDMINPPSGVTFTMPTGIKASTINPDLVFAVSDKRPSFPDLAETHRETGFDTDADGIPDAWENDHSLNPNDATDANTKTVDTKGVYSNLEVYLHSLVAGIMTKGAALADGETGPKEYWPLSDTLGKPDGAETSDGSDVNPKPGALRTIEQFSDIVAVEYYDLQGRRLAQPARGLSIQRTIRANGQHSSKLVSNER